MKDKKKKEDSWRIEVDASSIQDTYKWKSNDKSDADLVDGPTITYSSFECKNIWESICYGIATLVNKIMSKLTGNSIIILIHREDK